MFILIVKVRKDGSIDQKDVVLKFLAHSKSTDAMATKLLSVLRKRSVWQEVAVTLLYLFSNIYKEDK